MKPRLITAIALVVLSIGAALCCLVHINRSTGEIMQAVETAMAAAAADSADWAASTAEVTRLWEKGKDFMHVMLPHVNLNELEWAIGSLPEYQRQGDKALYIEHCVRSLQCLKTVQEMERPRLGNIF